MEGSAPAAHHRQALSETPPRNPHPTPGSPSSTAKIAASLENDTVTQRCSQAPYREQPHSMCVCVCARARKGVRKQRFPSHSLICILFSPQFLIASAKVQTYHPSFSLSNFSFSIFGLTQRFFEIFQKLNILPLCGLQSQSRRTEMLPSYL